MVSERQPVREPLRQTLRRTVTIAVIVGLAVSWSWGGLGRWPLATLLALWFSLGGHWVEVFFLNFVRPRLAEARPVQIAARLGVWLVGGTLLALGMLLTARALVGSPLRHTPAWYVGGLAFAGLELLVHLVLRLRGLPSFYDGRG
jgi:hypothetical protein